MSTDAPGIGSRPVYIGRQPIHAGRGRGLVGYELLFRHDDSSGVADRRGAHATSQVLLNAFTEFGLQDLVGDKLCFLNVTVEFLTGDLPLPIEPGRVVLEVLQSVPMDDRVIAGILRLVNAGFQVAVDDFVIGKQHEQLLSVASYVKINFAAPHDVVIDATARCRGYPDLKLVGERLETPAQVRLARRLRFDLIQGYALQRPETVTGGSRPLSRRRHLELFGALYAPDVTDEDVVALIRDDPLLHRLRRACNSALTRAAGYEPARAPAEVVARLGLEHIRRWVTLMLVTDITTSSDERLATVMIRAHLCEKTAIRLGMPGDTAFAASLLLGVAEVLDQPIEAVIAGLPLAPEVGEALRAGTGPVGQVLALVRSYESSDLSALTSGTLPSGSTESGYLASVRELQHRGAQDLEPSQAQA